MNEQHLDHAPLVIAPDGLEVRPLLASERGSLAQFHLPAGKIGRCIRHKTIEEFWFVTQGTGTLWREAHGELPLSPGQSFAIPPRAAFQVRAQTALTVIATTIPPWTDDSEAEVLDGQGPWVPTA